jgi:thiol-disulfide isomerase/thioredoxin
MIMGKHPNAVSVVRQLLKSLGVDHSIRELRQKLEEHPDYPSMIAISDCLTEFKVANEATKVPKEAYKEVTLPFIAHLNSNSGTFILVKLVVNGKIGYSDENHDNATMSEGEFLDKWSSIILRAEANEESGEAKHYWNWGKDSLRAFKIPALILVLLLGVSLAINSSVSDLGPAYYLYLFINLVGLAVTTLLLVNSIDTNNPLVQNLCSLGIKNGCNAILKTNASQLTSWLSWSEVGFFYFAGGTLSLIFAPSLLFIIVWLNVFAMPYSVYSVSYQYRHKSWCLLCCMVQALLALGIINILIFSLWSFSLTNLPRFFFYLTLFCFLLPIVMWYVLKPLFQQSVEFGPLKQQLKNFKYNSELFNQVLKSQRRYPMGDEIMPFVLGSPKAETIITMVSNPFCGPCARAHQIIAGWMKYRDDFQLRIIFTTANHDDDEGTKVSRHFSALTALNDALILENALSDWYGQGAKEYEGWAKRHPVDKKGEIPAGAEDWKIVAEKQKQWCAMAEITFTPTILINGYKLPDPYRLEDIKYLIA